MFLYIYYSTTEPEPIPTDLVMKGLSKEYVESNPFWVSVTKLCWTSVALYDHFKHRESDYFQVENCSTC